MSPDEFLPHDATPTRAEHPFAFRGSPGEYAVLWWAQTALAVLTFGVYLPWRKIRLRRYLYEHTFVAGSHFAYHARPFGLLKGYAVLAIGLTACTVLQRTRELPEYVWILVAALALPTLALQGHLFNAAHTSYRGIRFGLRIDRPNAQLTYGLITLVLVVGSAPGVLIALYLNRAFLKRHLRYGGVPFAFAADYVAFALNLLKGVAMVLLALGVLGAAAVLVKMSLFATAMGPLFTLGYVVLVVDAFAAAAFVNARTFNRDAETLALGEVRFRGTMAAAELTGIYLTNALVTLVTFGLGLPWAIARTHRYRCARFAMIGSIDSVRAQAEPPSADGNPAADAVPSLVDLGF